MSSTSKRPRAPVCADKPTAAGEVVTNWKIVRIVAGLAVFAGSCILLSAWSARPGGDKPAPKRAMFCEGAPEAFPRLGETASRSRELRREVVAYGAIPPVTALESELPPHWTPGPLPAPAAQPSASERLAASIAAAAVHHERITARELPADPPLAAPPAILPTLGERELLSQLGAAPDQSVVQSLAQSGVHALFGRNSSRSESAAARQAVAVLDLDDQKGSLEKLLRVMDLATTTKGRLYGPVTETEQREAKELSKQAEDKTLRDAWLARWEDRPDFRGLPFRKGASCSLNVKQAAALGAISQGLGRELAGTTTVDEIVASKWARQSKQYHSLYPGGPVESEPVPDFGELLVQHAVGIVARGAKRRMSDTEERAPQGDRKTDTESVVPALVQMVQARDAADRKILVASLANIPGKKATAALAQRALFDLARDVRHEAIAALAKRPAADARDQLLAGFRYPWPAIADHAAAALVSMDDEKAVPALVQLLDEPDPSAPFVNQAGHWAVRELTRVNHLRNCLLCHAPSLSSDDPVRGVVPNPGYRLPRQYYNDSHGVFVRADITYLKQDFSLMQPVKDHGPWPEEQRFDYFVRTRELSRKEIEERGLLLENLGRRAEPDDEQSYPQREAVLRALRKLTGQDHGRWTSQWRAFARSK